tara:strand:+ start:10269 stop:10637 length:369 start_codon:yes stop_codon:yes gene_type:complete
MAKLGVKLPITRDDINGYTMIGDFNTLIKQNLKMLILTDPGERVMVPEFGVGIRSYLFENFNNLTFTKIETDIREQVSKYLPVVSINQVLFDDSGEDFNTLSIAIVYSIPALNVRDLLQFTI